VKTGLMLRDDICRDVVDGGRETGDRRPGTEDWGVWTDGKGLKTGDGGILKSVMNDLITERNKKDHTTCPDICMCVPVLRPRSSVSMLPLFHFSHPVPPIPAIYHLQSLI